MANQETTNDSSVTEKATFKLLISPSKDFSDEELSEDMDGLRLNLPKIKIPAGGALQFEIPGDDPQNPNYARTLEGVILFNHAANAYWPDGSDDDENATPLCASQDGKFGRGDPGGVCAVCPLNAWGSGDGGKGKACKNMRILYLLRSNESVPVQIALPPTSIRPYEEFAGSVFAARRRGTCGSIVQIGLKRVENGGNTYSVATFRKLFDFEGDRLLPVKMFADSFKFRIKATLLTPPPAAAEQSSLSPAGLPEEIADRSADNSYSAYVADIDGDLEKLPA